MKRCDLKTFDSMRKSFKYLINTKEVYLKEGKNYVPHHDSYATATRIGRVFRKL